MRREKRLKVSPKTNLQPQKVQIAPLEWNKGSVIQQ